MSLNPELLAEVSEVLGGVGYLVGGSVRDTILERPVKDYDFCTPMLPDVIEQAVRDAGKKPILLGKRFGTIAFKAQGEEVEVTTFRTELYIPGDRKPEVQYSKNLLDDMSRRDFTMNAIAMNFDQQVFDPFGGRDDIEDKLIRPVGNGADRINDDPLRMLRAVRFAAQLGFDIDVVLNDHINDLKHKLMTVSRERWTQELDNILLSNNPSALVLLRESGLLSVVLPELHAQAGYSHLRTIGEALASQPADANRRWALLLNETGRLYGESLQERAVATELLSDGICARLRFSNDRAKLTKDMISFKQARHRGLWN